jgi:hypothetical protein
MSITSIQFKPITGVRQRFNQQANQCPYGNYRYSINSTMLSQMLAMNHAFRQRQPRPSTVAANASALN